MDIISSKLCTRNAAADDYDDYDDEVTTMTRDLALSSAHVIMQPPLLAVAYVRGAKTVLYELSLFLIR